MSRSASRRPCWRDDQGSGYMAAFIVLFATLTAGGMSVIADSSRIVAAERRATAVSFEAARAGAQAVDDSTIRLAGAATLDPIAAQDAAAVAAGQLLIGSSATLTSVEIIDDQVVVSITDQVDPWFPGLSNVNVTETGRARLAVGITEEGQ